MAKIKGFYKGFKFISQIFVVKEQEMEIGCPTDVKHVAHIGWDGPSGNGPTWMKEFSNAPEFQSSLQDGADTPGPNPTSDGSSLHSQGAGNSMGGKLTSGKLKDDQTSEAPTVSKKQKRKKIKPSSSSSKSTSRSSRGGKSKPKQPEMQSIAVAAAS